MKNKNKPAIEVFVTGMGIVTALGAGIQSHLQAARQSRTGLTIQSFLIKLLRTLQEKGSRQPLEEHLRKAT